MSFIDTLTTIANRIEGCAAVVILGIDGIPIERHVHDSDTSIDIETVAAAVTPTAPRSMRTASDTDLGDMREMIFATDAMSFLLRPITAEYFLLLALNRGGNVGRA